MPRRAPTFNFDDVWLSKSDVLTYARCPNRLWRQRIANLPVTEDQPQLQAGSDAHQILHDLYDQIDIDGILSGRLDLVGEYARVLPETDWATHFMVLEKRRWDLTPDKRKEDFFPILREHYMRSNNLQYYGTADRFDRTELGDYAVLDYKLSTFRKYMATDYRFELVGYAMLANDEKLFDRPVAWGGIIFLRDGTVFYERLKPVSIAAWKRRCKKTRVGIEEQNFWKKSLEKTPHMCNWCPYNGPCLSEEEQAT